MADTFVMRGDTQGKEVAPGVVRRMLAYSGAIMPVEIQFETGAVGTPHSHPHDQVTYIVSGRFRFSNGEEVREVGAGDSIRFAPDVVHGTACLEAGTVVDVFTPMREDFV